MAGRKLQRSEEDSAKMGALPVVRGGGRCLLPSGSSGGFRRVAGTSVMVAGWLVRAAGVCDVFLQVDRFLAEKSNRCL